MADKGIMVRNKQGRFIKGESGNPKGRPKGSKNAITVQKMMLEEAFRGESEVKLGKVLEMVVESALTGDKAAQKLIWDACVSKQGFGEDKSAGKKQEINVKTMNVVQETVIEGEIIDEEKDQPKETIQ